MNNKKIMALILKLMRQSELPLEEVISSLLDQLSEFDLLCLVNGEMKRVPFSQRTTGKPIGIFPFKGPYYLELEETEYKTHNDSDVNQERLPEVWFCDRVAKVVRRLNLYLWVLGKPQLEGSYLGENSDCMSGCGWIVGFDGSGDYHGGKVPATLRYWGIFKSE